MYPACTLKSNDSPTDSSFYLPTELSEVRSDRFLRIVGSVEDSCNSVPGCQVSITDTDNVAGKFAADILPDLIKKLYEICELPDNWDREGTAAPNKMAFLNAWEVIEVLRNLDFIPAKLVPSAEEGIGFYFTKENKYGFVECSNEGEIVVAMSDRGGHRRVEQLSDNMYEIEKALEELKDFIDAA
jgi:hypothetical protein